MPVTRRAAVETSHRPAAGGHRRRALTHPDQAGQPRRHGADQARPWVGRVFASSGKCSPRAFRQGRTIGVVSGTPPSSQASPPVSEPLTGAEEEVMRAFGRVMAVLPRALDADLQRDQRMSLSEYTTLRMLSEAAGRRMRMS